jgi:hypothetical protein
VVRDFHFLPWFQFMPKFYYLDFTSFFLQSHFGFTIFFRFSSTVLSQLLTFQNYLLFFRHLRWFFTLIYIFFFVKEIIIEVFVLFSCVFLERVAETKTLSNSSWSKKSWIDFSRFFLVMRGEKRCVFSMSDFFKKSLIF